MDLAVPQTFNRSYDWVMSLHVGELIPKDLEKIYFENLLKPMVEGLVLSWGNKLNPKVKFTNEKSDVEVIAVMKQYRKELREELSKDLRSSAKIFWFRRGLMVFTKERNDVP